MTVKQYLRTVLIFILSLIGYNGNASHVLGGEISYRSLGNSRYEVTVKVVRDCAGSQVSQSPIYVRGDTITNELIVLNNQTKISILDITPAGIECNYINRCSGGTNSVGFEQHIWVTVLDLTGYLSCNWVLSWEQCCRIGAITTGPANSPFFLQASLNSCLDRANSSPVFAQTPKVLLCLNSNEQFSFGAVDAFGDGDSLSYHLAAPRTGRTTFASWLGNYNHTRPIQFWGFPVTTYNWPAGFHLNAQNGDLAFRPISINTASVITVEVKEWRRINGIMTHIGSVTREQVVYVVNCQGTKAPEIPSQLSYTACAESEFCREFSGFDADGDTVRLSWSGLMPGMSVTYSQDSAGIGKSTLCWKPDSKYINTGPVHLLLTASKGCPFPLTTTKAVFINVVDKHEVSMSHEVLDCGYLAMNYQFNDSFLSKFNYAVIDTNGVVCWEGMNRTDTARILPGVYILRLSLETTGECLYIVEDSVIMPDYLQVSLGNDMQFCNGDSVSLSVNTVLGSGVNQYVWVDASNNQLVGQGSPQLRVKPDKQTLYYVEVTDELNCMNRDTISLIPFSQIVSGLDSFYAACTDELLDVEAIQNPSIKSYLWNTADTTAGIQIAFSGKYWVTLTDTNGCSTTDTLVTHFWQPQMELTEDTSICGWSSIELIAAGADNFHWYDSLTYFSGGNNTPVFQGARYEPILSQSKRYYVEGSSVKHGITCKSLASTHVEVYPLPFVDLGQDLDACFGDTVSLYVPFVDGCSYEWNTTSSDTVITIMESGTYHVRVSNLNNCSLSDTIEINFYEVKVEIEPYDKPCFGEDLSLQATGADSIRWFSENSPKFPISLTPSIRLQVDGTRLFWINGLSTFGSVTCSGMDSFELEYHELNPIQLDGDSLAVPNQNLTYTVQSNLHSDFTWEIQGGSMINGQHTQSVEVLWQDTGVGFIRVSALDSNECMAFDSMVVMIGTNATGKIGSVGMRLYPNPGKSHYTLEYTGFTNPMKYKVVNALGQLITQGEISNEIHHLNLESIPSGNYFLILETGERIVFTKE